MIGGMDTTTARPVVIDVWDRWTWAALAPADRETLTAWLAEHGVDPAQVYNVVVEGGSLTASSYEITESGRKFFDSVTGLPALAVPVTVPLRSPLPVSFPSRPDGEAAP